MLCLRFNLAKLALVEAYSGLGLKQNSKSYLDAPMPPLQLYIMDVLFVLRFSVSFDWGNNAKYDPVLQSSA